MTPLRWTKLGQACDLEAWWRRCRRTYLTCKVFAPPVHNVVCLLLLTVAIISDLCTVDRRKPASGCYQFFLETVKTCALSTDSAYLPIAGQHISAGVHEIFNQKMAPMAQGGGGGGGRV